MKPSKEVWALVILMLIAAIAGRIIAGPASLDSF